MVVKLLEVRVQQLALSIVMHRPVAVPTPEAGALRRMPVIVGDLHCRGQLTHVAAPDALVGAAQQVGIASQELGIGGVDLAHGFEVDEVLAAALVGGTCARQQAKCRCVT